MLLNALWLHSLIDIDMHVQGLCNIRLHQFPSNHNHDGIQNSAFSISRLMRVFLIRLLFTYRYPIPSYQCIRLCLLCFRPLIVVLCNAERLEFILFVSRGVGSTIG